MKNTIEVETEHKSRRGIVYGLTESPIDSVGKSYLLNS